MDICKSGHEEIIYEGWNCPVCEMIDKKDEEIEKLGDKINELETELKEKE